MDFQQLRKQMFELGCFTTNQVYAWQPEFDKNNLGRWVAKGYLFKLRNGFYSFPEYKTLPDFPMFVANRIYRPSYISLQTALAFYGMIPEAVVQITSVTSLKTGDFSNTFGEYSYQSVKEELMFGYDIKTMSNGFTFLIATPEKALLDLLYLHSFYDTPSDMLNLRLDQDFLVNEINQSKLLEYLKFFNSATLAKRTNNLLKAYEL